MSLPFQSRSWTTDSNTQPSSTHFCEGYRQNNYSWFCKVFVGSTCGMVYLPPGKPKQPMSSFLKYHKYAYCSHSIDLPFHNSGPLTFCKCHWLQPIQLRSTIILFSNRAGCHRSFILNSCIINTIIIFFESSLSWSIRRRNFLRWWIILVLASENKQQRSWWNDDSIKHN